MKRVLSIAMLLAGVLSGAAAFAHSEPENEPQRPCAAFRPHGAVPAGHPIEARKDAENHDYVGVCTGLGVVRVGTDENGMWLAADGSRGADLYPDSEPAEAHWADGYVVVNNDEEGNTHGYCAGGGQYENGDQPDDEFMTGDCGVAGPDVEPPTVPDLSMSPSPEPTPEESPSDSPSPEPAP